MSVLLVFTGCAGNTPEDQVNTSGSTDASESVSETVKSNIPPENELADRTEILNSYKFKNPWKTGVNVEVEENGETKTISLRLVDIDIEGDGEPIEIFQISDVHFSSIYDDEDSTVKASYAEWGDLKNSNGELVDNDDTIATFKRCVNYAADADRIVVTGDIANFYSRANLDTIEKYVFNPLENINPSMSAKIIAVGGNHDATFPLPSANVGIHESNRNDLAELYEEYSQNLDYYSEIIDGRVMIIQMDNATRHDVSSERFTEAQRVALENDIAVAKENGYTVLIFCHIPLPTQNSADGYYTDYDLDSYKSDGPSKSVYELITNNADVIKGYFAGHNHGDAYSEIKAKTSDGKLAFIPQYVLNAMYKSDGAMVKITLK